MSYHFIILLLFRKGNNNKMYAILGPDATATEKLRIIV